MSKIVGIDLGTTFSAIAHINENGVPELIPNEYGKRLTPSVIYYDDGEFIVGEYAQMSALAVPEKTVEFIKREIGKSITEFSREFDGKEYSAEDLSAEIIKTLKKGAETKLGEKITDAVITVPAYFNDPERQATIRAGEIAGLKVQRIINEPTAAAFSYGMHHIGSKLTVLVFDLGGGTFDVTIMEVDGEELNVLATNGNHHLGGKDWDDRIIMHAADTFEIKHGVNPLDESSGYQELQTRSVDGKINLSTLNKTRITINYAGKSDQLNLTRQEFEEMTSDLVEDCKNLVNVVLGEVDLTKDMIDTVLVVGGSTRMPMIQNMLTEHFGKPPDTYLHPDEAVVLGAAVMGELIESENTKKHGFLRPVTKRSNQNLGIKRISDVCSHNLGIAALDDIGELCNSIIIRKNTSIPCEVSKDYNTTSPMQTEIDVIVLQGGDDRDPRNSTVRDAYEFYDIPKSTAGNKQIKVTFKYNANGVIEVEAKDVESNKDLSKRKKVDEIDWDTYLEAEQQVMLMDIALVIDCSGSMSVQNKLKNAQKATIRFLDNIDPSFQVGLVSFQTHANLEMNLTDNFSELTRRINNLEAGGGNNDEGAIAIARDQILVNSQNIKVLVLLADGRPADRNAMLREANRTKQEDIRLIAIGVGNDVDSDLLKQVASTPEDYYFVEESVKLESTFTTLASRLVTESSARISGISRR